LSTGYQSRLGSPKLVQSQNGNYTIEFIPPLEGQYIFDIKIFGVPVKNNPLTIQTGNSHRHTRALSWNSALRSPLERADERLCHLQTNATKIAKIEKPPSLWTTLAYSPRDPKRTPTKKTPRSPSPLGKIRKPIKVNRPSPKATKVPRFNQLLQVKRNEQHRENQIKLLRSKTDVQKKKIVLQNQTIKRLSEMSEQYVVIITPRSHTLSAVLELRRTKFPRKWQPKYVKMKKGCLHYWESKASFQNNGACKDIPLDGSTISVTRKKAKPFVICISNEQAGREWLLAFLNHSILQNWLDVLHHIRYQKPKAKKSQEYASLNVDEDSDEDARFVHLRTLTAPTETRLQQESLVAPRSPPKPKKDISPKR